MRLDADAFVPARREEELPGIVAGKEEHVSNRDIILGRIREALKCVAPHPSSPGIDEKSPPSLTPPPQCWLPPVGDTLAEQIELFGKNAEALKAEFRVCNSEEEAFGYLQTLAKTHRW